MWEAGICKGDFIMAVHIQKRQDYISWDEYFMGVAMLSGMRSKDPNSQVGACIVSEDNKILNFRGREKVSHWSPSICM